MVAKDLLYTMIPHTLLQDMMVIKNERRNWGSFSFLFLKKLRGLFSSVLFNF